MWASHDAVYGQPEPEHRLRKYILFSLLEESSFSLATNSSNKHNNNQSIT